MLVYIIGPLAIVLASALYMMAMVSLARRSGAAPKAPPRSETTPCPPDRPVSGEATPDRSGVA